VCVCKNVFTGLILYHFITDFSKCLVIVHDQTFVDSALHKFFHQWDICNKHQYFRHYIYVYLTYIFIGAKFLFFSGCKICCRLVPFPFFLSLFLSFHLLCVTFPVTMWLHELGSGCVEHFSSPSRAMHCGS